MGTRVGSHPKNGAFIGAGTAPYKVCSKRTTESVPVERGHIATNLPPFLGEELKPGQPRGPPKATPAPRGGLWSAELTGDHRENIPTGYSSPSYQSPGTPARVWAGIQEFRR